MKTLRLTPKTHHGVGSAEEAAAAPLLLRFFRQPEELAALAAAWRGAPGGHLNSLPGVSGKGFKSATPPSAQLHALKGWPAGKPQDNRKAKADVRQRCARGPRVRLEG